MQRSKKRKAKAISDAKLRRPRSPVAGDEFAGLRATVLNRGKVAAMVTKLLSEDPERSANQIAKTIGVNPSHLSRLRNQKLGAFKESAVQKLALMFSDPAHRDEFLSLFGRRGFMEGISEFQKDRALYERAVFEFTFFKGTFERLRDTAGWRHVPGDAARPAREKDFVELSARARRLLDPDPLMMLAVAMGDGAAFLLMGAEAYLQSPEAGVFSVHWFDVLRPFLHAPASGGIYPDWRRMPDDQLRPILAARVANQIELIKASPLSG